MANYRNLIVWQKCHELALKVYNVSKLYPKEETYGIVSQIKRAALSIPTNIVEGYNKKSSKELIRFIDISLGSLAELEYLLEFSIYAKLIDKENINDIQLLIDECGKLLWSFQKSIKEKLQP